MMDEHKGRKDLMVILGFVVVAVLIAYFFFLKGILSPTVGGPTLAEDVPEATITVTPATVTAAKRAVSGNLDQLEKDIQKSADVNNVQISSINSKGDKLQVEGKADAASLASFLDTVAGDTSFSEQGQITGSTSMILVQNLSSETSGTVLQFSFEAAPL